MKLIPTEIEGAFVIDQSVFQDARGSFIKTFHEELFRDMGLECRFAESYYTESRENVVRGMHFQVPPHDHAKIATIISGKILDVIVDLRKKSKTYGKYLTVELSRKNRRSIYTPRGVAHGFCSLEKLSVVYYITTSVYSKEHDKGIRWDSFGFKWPINTPVLSERDQLFPTLEEFDSPF